MGVQPIDADIEAIQAEVSIPILRVGVQHYIFADLCCILDVSIPILRVGVQQSQVYIRSVSAVCFNSHTARGSSTFIQEILGCDYVVSIPILRVGVQRAIWQPQQWRSFVSIPILRVGVQHPKLKENFQKKKVSIPILRVGVQLCLRETLPGLSRFNSHTARGRSTCPVAIFHPALQFQFPYCAWEFKHKAKVTANKMISFNSHTARGSSTRQSLSNFGYLEMFQSPYCAWEFNVSCRHNSYRYIVSIPILRVGVQT